jgi:hypothetical protein
VEYQVGGKLPLLISSRWLEAEEVVEEALGEELGKLRRRQLRRANHRLCSHLRLRYLHSCLR